jgi:hypothetical protein
MKNLLEQLKPEILKEINDSAEKYPLAVIELKKELESLYYVSDIRYGSVIQLDSYHLAAFNNLPNNAWANFIN